MCKLARTKYISTVKQYESHVDLSSLWNNILSKDTPAWPSGIAFEYFILRAFELEGADITWPYKVDLFGESVEQIDGAVFLKTIGLTALFECKDYFDKKVSVEPLAKLRNQLLRRPAGCVGSVFCTTGFTEPAITLAHFSQPQSILLWERENISFCLKNKCFVEGLIRKVQFNYTNGYPNFDLTK